ncbi:DUF1588 domain-containing protein [Vulgatibacter sp.]|uniref:DUF1588 domain-containing protein n=1 Tax=Vulgatibacter sp. TaxID=1971226 RepID=UPI0035696B74
MRWRLPLLAALVASATACGSSEEASKAEDASSCVPTDKFFSQQVWQPFMGQQCYACHNAQGTARDSDLVLQPSTVPDYLRINLETVKNIARVEVGGTSVLLLKPSAQIEHGGGVQIQTGDEKYEALEELVSRFRTPVDCGDQGNGDGLAGLTTKGAAETLRKASLSLVGRLPTPEEEARVEDGGEEALSTILDEMMVEEAFYERVEEAWNDLFLTDRYLPGSRAIDLLDTADYPTRTWYQPPEGTVVDEAEVRRLRDLSNRAVAREAVRLVSHVIRNDRPFTEILTADYRLVNPFSAKTYGLDLSFADETDASEWKEAKVQGMEHAGVLTSHMFLNRFPTTATNRNRHRARMVFRFFLATDILKLAERPVDSTTIEGHNPTMNNPECTVCHGPMDPVAGAFMNWDARGRYRAPEEGWHSDMRPPGYGEATVPNDRRGESLRWLAEAIVADPLFVTATVQNTWTMLTGRAPLAPPQDPGAPDAAARQEAYETQNDFFTRVGEDFVADGYDFKTVVKRLVLGPYYRAENVEEGTKNAERFADLGPARFLTPEMLDRKIEAVTGYPWNSGGDGVGFLADVNQYRIFYGGIDSDSIVDRITAPNGVMANVGARMANEMACRAVPRDFVLDAADRRLFPAVELSYEPEDENGFEVPGAEEAIRANIAHLHRHVLGEILYPGDPELERTWQLFYETWKEGKAGIAAGTLDQYLQWSCRARTDFYSGEELPEALRVERDANYTARAWMAVMTYLLLDYRFLYE